MATIEPHDGYDGKIRAKVLLVRMLEYYIRIEQITKDKVDAKTDSNLESSMREHFGEDE